MNFVFTSKYKLGIFGRHLFNPRAILSRVPRWRETSGAPPQGYR